MKVSVIVPVYNLESYIGPCLTSLLQQETNFDFEVVVVDDCSTDNSLRVAESFIERFPNKLKVIANSTNKRLAETKKVLLSHVSGDYIAYVDGDDLALPGKLQAQADFLDNHLDCGLVYHDSEVFDSESGKVIGQYVRDYYNRKYIPDWSDITHLIRYGSFFQASALMYRRHDYLLECVDDQCKIILDQPFQILNAGYLNAKIGRIDAVLGGYRIHSNSFGAQTLKDPSRRQQVLADQLQAISNGRKFGVPDNVIAEGAGHYYMATAMFFLKRDKAELFNYYLDLSAKTDWRFDKRHSLLIERRDDLEACKRIIG